MKNDKAYQIHNSRDSILDAWTKYSKWKGPPIVQSKDYLASWFCLISNYQIFHSKNRFFFSFIVHLMFSFQMTKLVLLYVQQSAKLLSSKFKVFLQYGVSTVLKQLQDKETRFSFLNQPFCFLLLLFFSFFFFFFWETILLFNYNKK